MSKLLGFCKECGHSIYDTDTVEEYPTIYHCPNCGHPHLQCELWDSPPDYLCNQYEVIGAVKDGYTIMGVNLARE